VSSILKALGIDQDDLEWYHLAACANVISSIHKNNNGDKKTHELDPFFDAYESDEVVAKQVDIMCLSCPVVDMCYKYGVETKSIGVFGGIYLNLGKIDKKYNTHKTQETWKAFKKIHGKLNI
jgi:hypothetical protein